MFKVLLAVDGSANALRATRHVASRESTCREPSEMCLLNVQPPVASSVVRLFLSQRDLRGYHEEEGEKALTPAREELQRLGVPFTAEVRVGDPAETIVRCAQNWGCGPDRNRYSRNGVSGHYWDQSRARLSAWRRCLSC